jgi:hypothetical protein
MYLLKLLLTLTYTKKVFFLVVWGKERNMYIPYGMFWIIFWGHACFINEHVFDFGGRGIWHFKCC